MERKFVSCYIALLYACSVFLNVSCATLTLEKHNVQPIGSYQNSQTIDGLTVAVQPMTNSCDCKKHFGLDLISTGILPVLVVAENQHSTSSYTIFSEKITIKTINNNDSQASEPAADKIQSSEKTGNVLAGTGAALTVGAILVPVVVLAAAPALLIAGGKQLSDSSVIKHNFVSKKLYTETIPPGEGSSGFVYLKIPEENKLSDSFILLINTVDIAENKEYILEFNISLPGE